MPIMILSYLLISGIFSRSNSASDGEALNAFGTLLNVPGWGGNGSNFCRWKGIVCDSSRVRRVDISTLNLSGDLSLIAELTDLKSLDISKNSFTGSIPSVFGKLTKLEFLDLSWNNFAGVVPDELSALTLLRSMNISNNNLSGRIPKWISEFQSLEAFAAYENSLVGEIPKKLGMNSNLKVLNLHSNHIEGTIPVRVFSSGLQVLVLTGNNLSGVLPDSIGDCKNLSSLRLGNNNLTGVIPKSIGGSISLTYFEADLNHLSGEIPSEFALCSNLTLLNLMSNNLSGTIPANFGTLTNLEELILAGNNLFGEIPSSIFNLFNLNKMDLSENRLNGMISGEIREMTKLQYLLLRDNQIGGEIPPEIGNCVKLLELQIGGNSLTGRIPPEIGRLRNLQISLNLSSNRLVGELPPELGKLDKLVSLDVSNNQVSGEIPSSFQGMLSLIELNFSYNHLSGPLPSSGPFLKSSSSSFLPNENLCGEPLNLSCSGSDSSENHKASFKIVIAVIASGLAVFLTVIVVVILFMIRERKEKMIEIEAEKAPSIQAGHVFTDHYRQAIDLDAVIKATFKESNKVSSGTFSTLYKAVMPSGTLLYARKLKSVDRTIIHHQSKMIREVERLSQLNHANLVRPIGYVIYEDSAILLHRYMPNRTLAELLHHFTKTPEYQPDWETRFSIALGVAEGLAFLHHVAIIHLDVSSGNVFLDGDNTPLVGEVEISKLLDPSKGTASISAVAGSFGYIPPEYAYTMQVTAAGNVYSFGVVLLEILTTRKAVDEVFGEGMDLVRWVHGASGRGETPEQILDARLSTVSFGWRKEMLAALKVALLCTDFSPAKRPRMKEVVQMLQQLREN